MDGHRPPGHSGHRPDPPGGHRIPLIGRLTVTQVDELEHANLLGDDRAHDQRTNEPDRDNDPGPNRRQHTNPSHVRATYACPMTSRRALCSNLMRFFPARPRQKRVVPGSVWQHGWRVEPVPTAWVRRLGRRHRFPSERDHTRAEPVVVSLTAVADGRQWMAVTHRQSTGPPKGHLGTNVSQQ